jgi:hypothetical protein
MSDKLKESLQIMPLANLDNFSDNMIAIHQAAELFGPIANAARKKQGNWLHLAMNVHAYGLSSGKYPQGSELVLNLKEAAIFYYRPSGGLVPFPLKLHTQKSLFEAVLDAMKEDELAEFFADTEGDWLAKRLMQKIMAHKPDSVFSELETVSHENKLNYPVQLGSDYADALYTIFTGIARFRARLTGHLAPIVVWPEHFDLSTLWFKEAAMDEQQAHINIGFAPYTPGQFERPYLYAYAYPWPEDFSPPQAPSPAFWHSEGWKGIVVHYDEIAKQEDSALFVEELCLKIFSLLQGILAE